MELKNQALNYKTLPGADIHLDYNLGVTKFNLKQKKKKWKWEKSKDF